MMSVRVCSTKAAGKVACGVRRRVAFGVASVLCVLAGSASAMPPIMERVPDDAMVVMAIPSPESFEKNLGALNAAIESPMPIPSFKDMLTMKGLGTSVDTTKGVGVVIFAPSAEEMKAHAAKLKKLKEADEMMDPSDMHDDAKAVMLVPVTSYKEFVASVGGKPGAAGGVDAIKFPGEEKDGFVKDIGGGYAAVSDKKALLESFTGKPGANPMSKRLGKQGEKLVDESDAMLVVNMDQARALVPTMLEQMQEEMAQQAEMAGTSKADMEKQFAFMKYFVQTVSDQSQGMVGGMKFSAAGIAGHMNASFKEGSMLSKAFTAPGKPVSLTLAKLHAQPYIMAGAMDCSNADMKAFMKDMVGHVPMPGEQDTKQLMSMIDNTKGASMVMGFPMGGLMSGLFTSTVYYTESANPGASVEVMKQTIVSTNGKTQQGMTYKTSYKEGGAKVGEMPVDVWEMKMSMGKDENDPGTAQAMAMLFGPQGMGGYVAKTETGMYVTYAKSSELLSKAMNAGAGKGEPFVSDEMYQQTAKDLPANRIAEGYLNSKAVMDLVLPMAAMFGVQAPMDKIPEKLPPIGASLASDGGQARMSFFVPAPVIKTTVTVAQDMMMQFEGGFGGKPIGDAPDAEGEPKKDSGQPKF